MTLFTTKNAAEDAAVDSGKCLEGRRAHHIYAVRETQFFFSTKTTELQSNVQMEFWKFLHVTVDFHGDFP